LVNRYRISVSRVFSASDKTGVTSGAATAYSSKENEFRFRVSANRFARSIVFRLVLCGPLFV
jgi:hypothetical protein